MMRADFHSHILPGIDDGSKTVAESIEMLKIEAEHGITHVVATPHFYANSDTPARFLQRRRDAECRLREEMEKHAGLPKVSVGAEVYYFHGMSEFELLSTLTIDDKGFIMLEMPLSPWTNRMFEEIEQIYFKHGIVPVMAHIDRYIGPFQTYGIPERLSQMPVLVQANASFFLRLSTRGSAMRMLRQNQIQLLGSDCHNTSDRPPNLGRVYRLIEQRLGLEAVERIWQSGVPILDDECCEL